MANPARRLLVVRTRHGEVTKRTARSFTHVVTSPRGGNQEPLARWCGSIELAQDQHRRWRKRGMDAGITSVPQPELELGTFGRPIGPLSPRQQLLGVREMVDGRPVIFRHATEKEARQVAARRGGELVAVEPEGAEQLDALEERVPRWWDSPESLVDWEAMARSLANRFLPGGLTDADLRAFTKRGA